MDASVVSSADYLKAIAAMLLSVVAGWPSVPAVGWRQRDAAGIRVVEMPQGSITIAA